MYAPSYNITAWMLIFSSEFVSQSTQMSYKRRCFNMISLFPFNVCNKFMKGGEYKEKKNISTKTQIYQCLVWPSKRFSYCEIRKEKGGLGQREIECHAPVHACNI